MRRKEEFERSNAYVDGELDRDVSSELLEDAANDTRLARELSVLNKLKYALENAVDVPEFEIPEPARKRRFVWIAGLSIAAGLLVAIVAGLVWRAVPGVPNHGVPVAWAVEVHRSWKKAAVTANADAHLQKASASLDAHVPDLSAAKLYVSHVARDTDPAGQPALVIGYRGTRDCRITLLIDAAPETFPAKPINVEIDRLRLTVWRAGALRYFVVAEGMAAQRYRLVTEAIHRSSLERRPLDASTRRDLARNHASSPPCTA